MNALATFADRRQATLGMLTDVFGQHERVFLAFSGGKESIVLAHLCLPWSGRFRLMWANTGFAFPHVEKLVRSFGDVFGLEELRGDVLASWREDGLPTWLPPVANSMPAGQHQEPKLQSWLTCCRRGRVEPMFRFIAAQTEPAAFLHGQRHEDGAPGNGMSGWERPAGVEILAPLADWSTAEVMAYIEAEGIELPEHYSEVSDSLECSICPAALGERQGPQRVAYMARRYPDLLRAVLPGARRARNAARLALDILEHSLATAEATEAAAPVVLQFEPDGGDCVVAALATALGRPYSHAAALLGVGLDPATCAPLGLKGRGIDVPTLGARLLTAGIVATVLPVAEGAEPGSHIDMESVRTMLPGRRALVMMLDQWNGRDEPHALAWTGTRLLDCRGPTVRELALQTVPILAAVVLTQEHRA